jgi:hypothetical protein
MCCRSGFFICLGRRRAQCVVVADHDVIQVARKPVPADFCMRDVGGFGQWIITRYESPTSQRQGYNITSICDGFAGEQSTHGTSTHFSWIVSRDSRYG